MKPSLALLALTTFLAAPAAALAQTAPAPAADALADSGVRYTLVDAGGHVVGELVGEPDRRLRFIGVARTVRPAPAAPLPRADRDVHPDFSHALSAAQMQAAWQAEIDRLIPPALTGGG